MRTQVLSREGIRIAPRNGNRWSQIETWIKPRLVASLPQQLKGQLLQRGEQGFRDEAQDVLYLILNTCCPGAAEEKVAVLRQLQNPTPCISAEREFPLN